LTYLPSLLTLAGVWLLLVISPGPNFVTTVHHSISRSRRAGLVAALGVAAGTFLWVTVSIVGLGVLLARVSWLVEIIRLLGAIYLSFLGCKMIWQAHRQKRAQQSEHTSLPTSHSSSWIAGFLTNLSNPKTAVFFSSLFALLLPANPPIWFQLACIVTIVLISATWYCIVACMFSFGPIMRFYGRAKQWMDYITGGILVALGIRLAVSK